MRQSRSPLGRGVKCEASIANLSTTHYVYSDSWLGLFHLKVCVWGGGGGGGGGGSEGFLKGVRGRILN